MVVDAGLPVQLWRADARLFAQTERNQWVGSKNAS